MKDQKRDLVYRTTKDVGSPLSYMLATRHTANKPLLFFDEEANDGRGLSREIRYASNQKSPFVDEQNGTIITPPIDITDGKLVVSWRDVQLRDFLDIHPGNVENGGNEFYLQDFDKEAREEAAQWEKEDAARDLYKKLGYKEIEAAHN